MGGGAYRARRRARATAPVTRRPSSTQTASSLASGPVIGLFARSNPDRRLSVLQGATLVGGPFAGRYFVSRGGVLESQHWEGAVPRFAPLWRRSDGTAFAVAGLGRALYASDGIETVALDATTWRLRRRYGFGCAGMKAVTRTSGVDVIAFDSAVQSADAQVYALESLP